MRAKRVLSLLPVIVLTTGIALAQQSSTLSPTADLTDEPSIQDFSLFVDGGGFLGVYAEDITSENMARYNLRQVRGVGVTQVVKDSPAEKVGVRKGDVILQVDGENITSVRKLNRLVSEIAPDQSVRMMISRGGSEQELSVTMGKRETARTIQSLVGEGPRIWKWEGPLTNREGGLVFALGSGRRIGISTMELTRQLAEYFGIADGKGVLVTTVSEDGPAAKAGVKAGDVITAADGEAVDSTGDLSRVINKKKDGDVTLTIIRNKSQQTIRVTPKEGDFPSGTIVRPEVGRRIVIPRIEFPTIPEMNISIPQMELPTIPSVNIDLPRVKVSPKIKLVRGASGPI